MLTLLGRNGCVHRPAWHESDAESDADTESVVVEESADSVVWDAVAKRQTPVNQHCSHYWRLYMSTVLDGSRRALLTLF